MMNEDQDQEQDQDQDQDQDQEKDPVKEQEEEKQEEKAEERRRQKEGQIREKEEVDWSISDRPVRPDSYLVEAAAKKTAQGLARGRFRVKNSQVLG